MSGISNRPVEDEYVSPEQRESFRQARPLLVRDFSALTRSKRVERGEEFRRRLRAICVSDAAARGYWDTYFVPLLGPGAPPARSQPKPATPAPGQLESDFARALMALVAARPQGLTQKQCTQVLAGSESARIKAAGLDRLGAFGLFRAQGPQWVRAQLLECLRCGEVEQRKNGVLVVGHRR